MPHAYDATTKHIFHGRPADWLELGELPLGTAIQVVDADLSTVSAAADKLIWVDGPIPYGAHFEFQAGPDPRLDERVLAYQVLYRFRLGLEKVRSVVFLLRPEALTAGVTGTVLDNSHPEHQLNFKYKLVRVWEIPVARLLAGGLGTLPLAPIAAVARQELAGVVESMKRRLDTEVPPEEARELWTATRILMGLRWSPDLVAQLLKGVHGMKESATYQEIVREGLAEGRAEGLKQGLEQGLEQGIEQGIEQGRAAEARAVILRRGAKLLGAPVEDVRQQLEAIANVSKLEEIMDRLLDGNVNNWADLLS